MITCPNLLALTKEKQLLKSLAGQVHIIKNLALRQMKDFRLDVKTRNDAINPVN